jgi:hypothetical protein
MSREHAASAKHQAAVNKDRARAGKPGPLQKAMNRQAASNRLGISQQRLENHIAGMLLVGIEGRPLTLFRTMIKYGRFLASNSGDEVNILTSTKGYDNRRWAVVFVSLISQYTLERQLERVKLSPVFAIQADETTDRRTSSEMVVNIQYVDIDDKYTLKSEYLTMITCNATTGRALADTVLATLHRFDLDPCKLVSKCCCSKPHMLLCMHNSYLRLPLYL